MVRARVANGKALMVLVGAVLLVCGGGGLPAAVASGHAREEVHLVPAVYVFGDSTVDVGNNQYLPGNAPLQLPYGIDFPQSRATGRFSNGYNVADSISRILGFKRSPPAYLSLTPQTSRQIFRGFRGANYASGGSGILDTTGNTLTLTKQVELFAATKSKMTEYAGGKGSAAVDALLSKSLFLISDGGNDMFAFILQNRTAAEAPSFYTDLLSNYTKHVQTGCVPNATYCGNRNDHLFWDGVHGTQATSNKGAKAIFDAPVKMGFAAPINFKQLISS